MPKYKHDCNGCQYIYTKSAAFGKNLPAEYDFYFCPQNDLSTMIARYGSEGGKYISHLLSNIHASNHSGETFFEPFVEAYNYFKKH